MGLLAHLTLLRMFLLRARIFFGKQCFLLLGSTEETPVIVSEAVVKNRLSTNKLPQCLYILGSTVVTDPLLVRG